ncbi:MAG: hypothetical protein KH328_01370 [Staphylococcus sp.]|jgi:hypothetical protein|nr:hypothetical protein [Staphylococcus sp.]
MSILNKIQTILDSVLLQYGILSSHQRRIHVNEIENSNTQVNQDEYVVYRIVSTKSRFFGDGKKQALQTNIDINYFYRFDKNSNTVDNALDRIHLISKTFDNLNECRIINGLNELYDLDNDFRGFNIEVALLEVGDI